MACLRSLGLEIDCVQGHPDAPPLDPSSGPTTKTLGATAEDDQGDQDAHGQDDDAPRVNRWMRQPAQVKRFRGDCVLVTAEELAASIVPDTKKPYRIKKKVSSLIDLGSATAHTQSVQCVKGKGGPTRTSSPASGWTSALRTSATEHDPKNGAITEHATTQAQSAESVQSAKHAREHVPPHAKCAKCKARSTSSW